LWCDVISLLQCSESCRKRCHQFGTETCCQGCPQRVADLCKRFRLCRHGECLCSDPDTLLMAAFADGDNSAFDALYRRNYDWVQKLAYQILRNRQDAQDVAQDAFLRVIASRKNWRATARFRSWMHRIVVNLCLKRQKRLLRQETISLEELSEDLDELPPELLSTGEDLAKEAAEVLQDALSHLPQRQRQVLELRLQGYSISQIARLLGCSRGAVDALLHRARKSLRKRLGKD